MVPKSSEVHIIRDSWTKLNVAPAKIMKVSSLPLCLYMPTLSSGTMIYYCTFSRKYAHFSYLRLKAGYTYIRNVKINKTMNSERIVE